MSWVCNLFSFTSDSFLNLQFLDDSVASFETVLNFYRQLHVALSVAAVIKLKLICNGD